MAKNVTDDEAQKVEKIIGAQDLKKLVNRCNKLETEGAETRAQMGTIIEQAESNKGLHRKAFQQIRRLCKMEPAMLNSWLQHFDAYREHMELDAKAGEDMFEGAPKKRGRPKKNTEAQGENVLPLRQAAE